MIDPSPGVFITFDARSIPHAVTPLRGATTRISAPMNYYEVDAQHRPDGLDAYLYRAGDADSTQGVKQ